MADTDKGRASRTTNHRAVLDNAEATNAQVLAAYAEHMEDRKRFQAILGPGATGSTIMGYVRKYGPTLLKYTGAAGGGAGALAFLGNAFPPLARLLGGS